MGVNQVFPFGDQFSIPPRFSGVGRRSPLAGAVGLRQRYAEGFKEPGSRDHLSDGRPHLAVLALNDPPQMSVLFAE